MVIKASAAVFAVLLMLSFGVAATPCETEDFLTKVSGGSECLVMRRYGSSDPSTLVVWLHGNISTGGPANSHFKLAEATAKTFESEQMLAVALVRPGYPDGTGEYSSGSDNGRADNWHRQTVVDVGSAIGRIKKRFNPKTTLIVGHSGGAAIAAVLLGLQPDLADAAVLIGCPCDMVSWRLGRSRTPWMSEDPLAWINQVSAHAKVTALTGDQDNTTPSALAKTYISRLHERSIKATFVPVPEAGHIDLLKSQLVMDAISELIH